MWLNFTLICHVYATHTEYTQGLHSFTPQSQVSSKSFSNNFVFSTCRSGIRTGANSIEGGGGPQKFQKPLHEKSCRKHFGAETARNMRTKNWTKQSCRKSEWSQSHILTLRTACHAQPNLSWTVRKQFERWLLWDESWKLPYVQMIYRDKISPFELANGVKFRETMFFSWIKVCLGEKETKNLEEMVFEPEPSVRFVFAFPNLKFRKIYNKSGLVLNNWLFKNTLCWKSWNFKYCKLRYQFLWNVRVR